MAANKPKPIAATINIQQLCDRILSTKELTRQDHMQLMSLCLNDGLVTAEERRRINEILDNIQLAQLHFLS
jgi:hypothetical protein